MKKLLPNVIYAMLLLLLPIVLSVSSTNSIKNQSTINSTAFVDGKINADISNVNPKIDRKVKKLKKKLEKLKEKKEKSKNGKTLLILGLILLLGGLILMLTAKNKDNSTNNLTGVVVQTANVFAQFGLGIGLALGGIILIIVGAAI